MNHSKSSKDSDTTRLLFGTISSNFKYSCNILQNLSTIVFVLMDYTVLPAQSHEERVVALSAVLDPSQ